MTDSSEPLRQIRAKLEQEDLVAHREFLESIETLSLDQANALTPVVRRSLGRFEGYVTRQDPRRRVLSVVQGEVERFPAFQWRDGQLVPSVSVVCRMLDLHFTQWQEAFWFVAPNGWLGGLAPIDLLSSQPEEVVLAAHYWMGGRRHTRLSNPRRSDLASFRNDSAESLPFQQLKAALS